jgi:hypothetical protein
LNTHHYQFAASPDVAQGNPLRTAQKSSSILCCCHCHTAGPRSLGRAHEAGHLSKLYAAKSSAAPGCSTPVSVAPTPRGRSGVGAPPDSCWHRQPGRVRSKATTLPIRHSGVSRLLATTLIMLSYRGFPRPARGSSYLFMKCARSGCGDRAERRLAFPALP